MSLPPLPQVPGETLFCPGPYLIGWAVTPCLLDTLVAAGLLAFIVTAGFVWCFRIVKDSRSHQPEESEPDQHVPNSRTPLLPQTRSSSQSRQHHSARPLVSILGRLFTPIILGTFLVDLALNFYQATHPDLLSNVTRDLAASTLANTGQSFAWLVASTIVLFADTLDRHEWRGGPNDRLPGCVKMFWAIAYVTESLKLAMWGATMMDTRIDRIYLAIFLIRYTLTLALIVALVISRMSHADSDDTDDIESQSATASASTPTAANTPGWRDTWRKVGKLAPFLWPKPFRLKLLVVLCFVCLALGRLVNVLVPLQYKRVVDALTPNPEGTRPYFAWGAILLYTAFRFLQGGVGLLSSLQYWLYIPVGQYTTREVSVRMLEHLHSLSLQFHINRKTGEVLRVMDRGTSSIGSLLSYLAFNILPVFVDIFLACVVFLVTFDWSIALVVFVTMVLYIFVTIWITEWRTKFRREMNELDAATRQKAMDGLLNFETVKLYGNERLEVNGYEEAIMRYQAADFKSSASLNVLNTAQNAVITFGLLTGLLMCAKRVSDGVLTVGDFVAFLTYLLQLYQPLNWFGTYYRVIQQNFIDMEKMLDLFEEGDAVKDAPNAGHLQIRQGGKIVFDNVSFSYDPRQPAVNGLSFEIPAGKTVALVGPSGGGKSTVFRLLFRFYDVQSGSVKIDGQDIRSVLQSSLRSHIGVVPQDTVLFNDTIRYNIRYGNVSATDEEVVAAAKAAQIHERILTFPDGYDTRVGERGLRLSGGEKQRIAIARTILKNPSIILLDEATSALDNTTERLVQEKLTALGKGRTCVVIAHRLTTVVDADLIFLVKDGAVVERGTHEELMDLHGAYYGLWMRQLGEQKEEEMQVQEEAEGQGGQVQPGYHHH